MENPFLLEDIEDKNEYNLQEYLDIQDQMNYKVEIINNIISDYYPPKNNFYQLWDFKYRCTKSLKQKFVDAETGRLPVKNLYKFGDGGDNSSCIICCTPFSHDLNEFENHVNEGQSRYIASQNIIKSLKDVGFNGYLYLFNGGFPNPTGTEMKYAGVPYCFKIFMFLEAKKRGFEKVIWIDSGCYATNNPQRLFDILDTQETIIKTIPSGNNNYDAMCFTQTIDILNSTNNNDIHTAEYIETIVFGLNTKHENIQKIIADYYDMVELGLPFLSIFPEEIVLTSLFNKIENKKLLYKIPELDKLKISEKYSNAEDAKNNGFYFLHTNYKKYSDKN